MMLITARSVQVIRLASILGGVDWSGSVRLGPIRAEPVRPGPVKTLHIGMKPRGCAQLLAVIEFGSLFFGHAIRGEAPPGTRRYRRLRPSPVGPPAGGCHAADPQALPGRVPAAR